MGSKEVIKAKVSALSAQVLELLRLEQSLSDPETPRDCILNEIAARQSIFAEVQSQIAALKTRQNELLPIHRFPVEILAIILSTALPLSGYHKRRTNLLLVCHTWANVINTNPSTFWTTLSTDDYPSQHDRLLQMCRQMPVTIYMDCHHPNNGSLGKLLEDIRSKRFTLRELVFVGSVGPLVEEVLTDWLLANASQLRSLDIAVNDPRRGLLAGNTNRQHVQMNSIAAPSLKSVRLFGVSIPWNAAILQGLHSLSLENLVSLTVGELFGILQGCPDLRSLTLRNINLAPADREGAPTPTSLTKLMTANLSGLSLRSTCDLFQCIQTPSMATVSVNIQNLIPDDDWQVNLGVLLSQLTQNRIIGPIHLEMKHSCLTFSAMDFQLGIPSPNEEREKIPRSFQSTYKELFSSLGAPTLTAVTSLHLDSFASQNSTAILMAANEFLPNLCKLSIPPYKHLKSKKHWCAVLEKVAPSTEETGRSVSLCPKLTSLEITTSGHLLDISSILQLVRIRGSDRRLRGKEVEKSPMTSIHITLNGGNLSARQTGMITELKSEVTDVRCISARDMTVARHGFDGHFDFNSLPSLPFLPLNHLSSLDWAV
ncbi:hypothetical protein M407DRAFT_20490 [Tulasnella calospora MUT 4182]|uniref:F-box domain-containing protein n=1 Tax=Tulasnella calospora MUT 4182 TaxID=1051891 RepID=A0A0C3QPX8_9AGAM|nr:hypothetical protein M407DRAFT_20490 [Tulasnella calospora MUT 4182]